MKIEQLVASVQRLQMVKNRSKLKASVYNKDEKLKTLWSDISNITNELLEIYNNIDIKDNELINKLYDQEWQLYAKMKILNNKYNLEIDNVDERFKVIEGIKMSEIREDAINDKSKSN
jgi:hypothetical protein